MRFFYLFILSFLFAGCSNVFYQPSPIMYVNPKKLKLTYEDLYFKSKDGTELNAWFFKAKTDKPKGTVVQFHGNAQNISAHFLSLVWVIEQGYNLFTFDYRGYAISEGKPSQAGIYLDALAALEKAEELHNAHGGGKFIVYGQSTGGAIALRAVPDYKNYENISLVVMDSAFSSYQDIAYDKLKSSWLLFPISPLAYVLVSDKYAADKVFNKITRPTLVIVGMQDRVVPPKFGKKIYKKISSNEKWLWKMPEGTHIDAYHHGGNIYRDKFLLLVDGLSR